MSTNNSIKKVAKRIGSQDNVCIRVIDEITGNIVSQHIGHNSATNSMLEGIGHYLIGDGILNQGYDLLSDYIPKYISLGTMGLYNQDSDEEGLPTGIGNHTYLGNTYNDLSDEQRSFLTNLEGHPQIDLNSQIIKDDDEILRMYDYLCQCPGFGSDGYDLNANNNREYSGLGPVFKSSQTAVKCELISDSFPRASISYRDIVPEFESECPKTIDIVYSALISTGALSQFRGNNNYIYISEAGLWSSSQYKEGGYNGLLAGYRLAPSNIFEDGSNIRSDFNLNLPDNRRKIKENIIRVGKNQVVQVIWKIQLGGIDQLGSNKMFNPDTQRVPWLPMLDDEFKFVQSENHKF